MIDTVDFFDKKRPWSKYKDLILDYYLQPYLSKVARLGRPVAIVDCFAGAGRFEDGELGSPLIIVKRLRELHAQGRTVRGVFIESHDELFRRLETNLAGIDVPVVTRKGDFRDYVGDIVGLAASHTVFAYVDPFKPADLLFHDLEGVYAQLHAGQSIETLINFPSTGFVRRALGLWDRAKVHGALDPDHREVIACNEIAGGTYWQDSVTDNTLAQRTRIDRVADGYARSLHQWFKFVLTYAIRERYEDEQPKYHLVFGSRHPDAIDLMNRAMVKARRQFVGARFVEGMLFANQPAEEVIDPHEIAQAILDAIARIGKTKWKDLRVHATISHPCKYNDSEFNRAIKEAIKSGRIGSSSLGTKVEESAEVWSLRQNSCFE